MFSLLATSSADSQIYSSRFKKALWIVVCPHLPMIMRPTADEEVESAEDESEASASDEASW